MPNSLTATGLTLATQQELVATYTAAYQAIFGPNINLDSSSPDGQWMMITVQALLDQEDVLMQVYSTMDPDNAFGTILDQRVALNGIQRLGGSFTTTNVTVVTSQALTLNGLDNPGSGGPYTVADNQGNQYNLINTAIIGSAGSNILAFQAANAGAITPTENTITVPVTVVLGVTSINNPSNATTIGVNEETDAALKIRRQQSVSLSSQGYLQGLIAALENLAADAFVAVYENNTGSTVNTITGHTIWVIFSGSASNAAIANAIYTKRNAGCGMKGTISFGILQVDGSTFTVLWDTIIQQNLFVAFTATSLNGTNVPDVEAMLNPTTGLPATLVPAVFAQVNINDVATLVQDIDPNSLVTSVGLTNGQVQMLNLSAVAASGTFVLNYNGHTSSAINWNDSVGTIQSKVQAMTGLSTATVSGSIASRILTITLSPTIISVLGLIYVTSNSLMTSGPAAVTFSYNFGYANSIQPSASSGQQNYKYTVSDSTLVITPVINQINPTAPNNGGTPGTIDFTASGGYVGLTWTITTNNSGGSIGPTTGIYVTGTTGSVTDVVQVTDVLGNFAQVSVTVT